MDLSNIPGELFEKIALLLDTKSYVTLSECSKELYSRIKEDPFIWRKKAFLEYSKTIQGNDETKYIKLFNTMCIGCAKKTKVVHPFAKERICSICQKKDPKYTTLSASLIKKLFHLNKQDIAAIRCHEKPNHWNGSRPIRLYLLSDVMGGINAKFGSYANMLVFKKELEAKKFKKRLLYHTRFTILRATLLVNHDIEILEFTSHINRYSKGLFTRYLHNISKRQNYPLANTLVNLCIEMDFLRINGFEPDAFNRDDFHKILRFLMLNNHVLIQDYPDHIFRWIMEVEERYADQFERKKLLVAKLQGLDFSLTDTKQMCYIDFGIGDLEDIRLDIIEENFIIANFDYLLISREFVSSSGSKREHYSKCIKRHLLNGGQIPEELKARYNKFL